MSKRSLTLSLAAASLLTLAGWSTAQASLFRAMDLPALVAAADRIVVADVLSVSAGWDGSRRTIRTAVEIGVRESWKGAIGGDGRLTVRQLGGTVGEIEMTVHGSAKFAVGERALLFLRGSQVVGMSQGKRTVRWEAARRRWLVTPAARAHLVQVGSADPLRAAEPDRDEDLDTLRVRVRSLVGN